MKNIIVAMDFSKAALNALDYAINVALSTESEIVLLWVDSNIEGKYPSEKNEVRNDAKLELKTIIEERKTKYETLQLSYKLKRGKIYQEIANLAKAIEADLVIVGTHGVSGFEEFWIGSNAFKIISYSPCPVISVRPDFVMKDSIKKIIIPIDDSFETTKKVPMASKIAKAFDADILVLSIYESELPSIRKKTDVYVKESIRFIKSKSINVEESNCPSNNIPKSIVEYAEKAEADLIVIMTDQNIATLNIMMGINAQQILNRSSIPILSVKPDKMEF